MNEKNATADHDQLPDRLSINPKSPYYNESLLERGVATLRVNNRGHDIVNRSGHCITFMIMHYVHNATGKLPAARKNNNRTSRCH